MKGNIIVVSHRANAIKRDATLEELRRIVAFYEPLEFGVVEEGDGGPGGDLVAIANDLENEEF